MTDFNFVPTTTDIFSQWFKQWSSDDWWCGNASETDYWYENARETDMYDEGHLCDIELTKNKRRNTIDKKLFKKKLLPTKREYQIRRYNMNNKMFIKKVRGTIKTQLSKYDRMDELHEDFDDCSEDHTETDTE